MEKDFKDILNAPVPPEIVDTVSWKKYLVMKESATLKRIHVLASDGTEINLMWFPRKLHDAIKHLSTSEREEILEMYTERRKVQVTANRLLALARGSFELARKRKQAEREEHKSLHMSDVTLVEDIKELLGKMFTPREVVRILAESREIEVELNYVQDVLKRFINDIEKRREEFRNRVQDVRLYSKRPRLEELSWMYTQMKMRYNALRSNDAYNSMLRTLEQIRKEAEGDQIFINGAIDVNVETEIRLHIQQTIYKSVNLKEIILGRVAARMNWDLAKLVAGLHNSYYAKFMPTNDEYDPQAEMEYPSSMNYDFNRIQHNHAVSGIDEVEDVKAQPLTDEERSSSEAIKQLFLQRIAKQREALEGPKHRAEAEVDFWRSKFNKTPDEDHELTREEGRVPQHKFNKKQKSKFKK
jgi:hypothetical protein